MEKQYESLLNHLYKVEGGKLHRNEKESDITNSYGIYRAVHPKAEIFTYIDKVALTITKTPSKSWDKKQIDTINKLIDKNIEKELSYRFYKEYLKTLDITQFPEDLVISIVDCFTNTPLGTWKSLQEALNDCHKYKLFSFTPSKPRTDGNILAVDGSFGAESKRAMKAFKDASEKNSTGWKDNLIFKNCMLMYMKTNYVNITLSNHNHLINLKGWVNNRMENAQHI